MENKYQLLLDTLDSLIKEAPQELSNKYDVSDEEKLNASRARALIHLFLRTRFGMINFIDTERQITDGSGDGGLDGYYIDEESQIIYLIQSKFRTKEENFEINPVNGYELFKMELKRILTDGEDTDSKGNRYNGKIMELQRKIGEISNIGKYKYRLIFLGNIPSNLDKNKLLEVSGSVCDEIEIINGKDAYNTLLLPYLQFDFYNKREFVFKIKINQNQSNRINHAVKIEEQNVNINLSFIPTKELARMMFEYKNSILRYNPRCYVGIKKGGVNHQIYESMSDTSSNEFALLNNGITVICTDFEYNERNAEHGTATLIITNPQIVNGGQTAFTLARLYSEEKLDLFEGKEVLVKFISLNQESSEAQVQLIERISEATNNQTPVYLSDRKSNDELLHNLQKFLFENHGILLERKRGEFFEAVDKKIISKSRVLDKELVMRFCFIIAGKVAEARSYSETKLFEKYLLKSTKFEELYQVIQIYKIVESYLQKTSKQDEKFQVEIFGFGLKYGKFAITYAILASSKKCEASLRSIAEFVKNKWKDFEITVANLETNQSYFHESFDYANYYKGKTINKDLIDHFNKESIEEELKGIK